MNFGIWITIVSAAVLLLFSAARCRGKQLASAELPAVASATLPEQATEEFRASPAPKGGEGETSGIQSNGSYCGESVSQDQ